MAPGGSVSFLAEPLFVSTKMKKILVTGGTGFIGGYLVSQLVEAGYNVTILASERYGVGKQLPAPLRPLRAKVELVYADLRHFSQTKRAIRQASPQIVVHLAAAGATEPFLPASRANRHNLAGTINLLRACFGGGECQQAIVARTPGELSPMNVYAASKAAAWSYCQMYARTYDWRIHGGMIFQAYGEGQPGNAFVPSAIAAALAGDNFPMSSGGQKRDWIFAADVAAGLTSMIDTDLDAGMSVDIGTGVAVSLLDVAQKVYQIVGRGGAPLPGKLPNRPGDPDLQQADAERTAKLIGWLSTQDLSAGLRKLIDQQLNRS